MPIAHDQTPSGQSRARGLRIPFAGRPGPWNAVTDVPGIEVGYVTLIQGDRVRTGVTGIHPRGRSGTAGPVAAGFHGQNGNGEMTGVSWITESGRSPGRSRSPTRTRSASRTPGSSTGRCGTTPRWGIRGCSR